MKALFFLASLLLLQIPAQGQVPSCQALFSAEPLSRLSSYIELERYLENPADFLRSMLRSSSDLKPTQFFGKGISGTVWKVETPRGPQALKILFKDTDGLTDPYDLRWVGIQDVLAKEEMAPRIHGVIHEREMKNFAAKHAEFFERYQINTSDIAVGVLMDIADAPTLKSRIEQQTTLPLDASTNETIERDLPRFLKVLEELGIEPRDPDAVVLTRADGSKFLQLIDITGYERGALERAYYETYFKALAGSDADGRSVRMGWPRSISWPASK